MKFWTSMGVTGKLRSFERARLTWAGKSVSQTVTSTALFLRRQLWIWPVIAVVLLSVIGFYVRHAIETTMRRNVDSELNTLLSVEVAMVKNWLTLQQKNAEAVANDAELRALFYRLLDIKESNSERQTVRDEAVVQEQLSRLITAEMIKSKFVGYFVTNRDKKVVASSHAALVGRQEIPAFDKMVTSTLDGATVVSPPTASVLLLKDVDGQMRTGVPIMLVSAPIRDTSFQVVGVLTLQLRPQDEFTQILQLGRLGKSGETYAFDKTGLMVSNSRFDHELILHGLIVDRPDAHSIVELHIRDPGADMTRGFRPKVRRSELRMTEMAAAATAGKSGSNVQGYRDYRGVQVVGAWEWLDEYQMGMATEIDYAEAFRPLTILQRTFWTLYALLVTSAIAIFVFTVIVARLQRDAQKAAIKAKQLGQYTLEDKLGEGGMGVVYRGYHAMLRRPTAIKLLHVDKTNEAAIERFEKEVQITCQLTNPNTIAIYDYGRTPEGIFYYAMEYLDGINLQSLIDKYGPQTEGRVIHILEQVCGSLYEAHSKGLVHRDIKPANIMLNHRGGEPDFVKVLDFGLVREVHPGAKSQNAEGIVGTPLYVSPEAIQSPNLVDACSDIYAVGAVGYFLLTGTPVFEAGSLRELLELHVTQPVESPSDRLHQKVSSELEHALLSCLEKARAKRPQTARDLAHMLRRCPAANDWNVDKAAAWWLTYERAQRSGSQILASDEDPNATFNATQDFSE